MGIKLMWGGVTCILSLQFLFAGLPFDLVGYILLSVGYVLYLLDK